MLTVHFVALCPMHRRDYGPLPQAVNRVGGNERLFDVAKYSGRDQRGRACPSYMNVITFGPDARRHVLKEFAQSEQQDNARSLLSGTDRDGIRRRDRHERLLRWRQRT
jgi:hypothetical protein